MLFSLNPSNTAMMERDQGCALCYIVEIGGMDEEVFAVSNSSDADKAFDSIIGCIEEIILEDEFHQLWENFMEKYYLEFDDSDENKLSYTPIFNEYGNLLEKHVEQQLVERIPDFNMNTFTEQLMEHKDEVQGDIFDTLMTFTDFVAFKEMFLEYRAEKEGRALDPSQELVVTPLTTVDSEYDSSAVSQ